MAKSMLNKISAGFLLVLSLSPFTAPFATCDLATLLGHAVTDHALPAHRPSRAASAQSDASLSLAPSSRLARAARVKLQLLRMVADGRWTSATDRMSPRTRGSSDRSAAVPAPGLVLATILRL